MKIENQDLLAFDAEHVWHPFTSLHDFSNKPLVIRGEGVYLFTSDERKIIDAVSSWWVNIHGHANKKIAAAIYKQALELEHVIFAGFTHQPAIQLSKNLLSILPANQSRVFFSDNGSTAVEVGIKMAMQYWFNQNISKPKLIALNGAYHGDTFGAMSVGERGPFTRPFFPYLFEVEFVDVPTSSNIESVVARFEKLTAQGDVGAFIFEPLVQGASGMIMYEPVYLDELMKIAKRNSVVCIADEVFTGFGRTGKMFACDYLANQPDIMCVSKGITGGTVPLGVTTCSKEIENAFQSSNSSKTFFHGHSYTANPIACAAANASYEILVSEDCQTSIQRISERHQSFCSRIASHGMVKDARHLGTIMAIEIKTDENTSYFNNLKKTIYQFFSERNILMRPLGNILYVLPPYVITEEQLAIVYQSIEDFLRFLNTAKEQSRAQTPCS